MRRPESPSRDEWMDARVEAYVDGDLSRDERQTFESIMDDNPHWRVQVRQAERIQNELHDLPTPSCPADVTQAIFERTSRAHQPLPWWKDLLQQFVQTWRALVSARRRPVVDYAVGIALVGVAVFFIVNPIDPGSSTPNPAQTSSTLDMNAPIQAPYSKADVQRATARAAWTFQYVSTAGDRASKALQSSLEAAAAPASGAKAPTSDASTPDASTTNTSTPNTSTPDASTPDASTSDASSSAANAPAPEKTADASSASSRTAASAN